MAEAWYVEYSFKQHAAFHEAAICVVPGRPLLPAGNDSSGQAGDSFPTTNEPKLADQHTRDARPSVRTVVVD